MGEFICLLHEKVRGGCAKPGKTISEDYWNRVLPNQKSPYLQRARSQGFKRLNAKFSICSSVNFSFAQNLGKQ